MKLRNYAWGVGGVAGNCMIACNLVGMYLMMRWSSMWNKRSVVLVCFALIFLGNASYAVT
jgi:hypothetical protein